MLISLVEYAKNNGKEISTVRRKAESGSFKTTQKIGRNRVVDSDEPYIDNRVTSGKYKNWRNKTK